MLTTIITSISALLLGLFGKDFWSFVKENSRNKTKENIHQIRLDKDVIAEMKKLEREVMDLKNIIYSTGAALETLLLILAEELKDKPNILKAFETATKDLKKK